MSAEHAFPADGLTESFQALPVASNPTDHVYSLAGYDQLVIFHNPNSSHATSNLGPLHTLEDAAQRAGLTVTSRHTSPHPGGTTQTLQRDVSTRTIIGVRAGDGGLGQELSDIRALGLENPVLAIPGGNKNDIATSLGAAQLLADPDMLLRHAHLRRIHPLVVSFGPEGEESTSLDAYGYASIGISSLVAARINDPAYRSSPLLRVPGGRYLLERYVTSRTFMHAPPFSATYPEGRAQPTLDLIAANASRMAGSLRPRADLFEHRFRLITVRHKLGALAVLGGMMLGAPVGETVEADEQRSFTLDLADDQEVHLQVDGEHHRLRGRLVVNFAMAATGVNVLVPPPKESFITAP